MSVAWGLREASLVSEGHYSEEMAEEADGIVQGGDELLVLFDEVEEGLEA